MSAPIAKLIAAIGTWISVATLAGVIFSTWFIVNAMRTPGTDPAFLIDRIRVRTPVVEPGQPVRFEMEARRYHACASIIASFWLGEDGEAWTRFPPLTGGYTDVNPDGYTISFSVPAPERNTVTNELPRPGLYRYKSINAPLCDNLGATETPPVSICLVVPGLPRPACSTQTGPSEWVEAINNHEVSP